MLPVYDNSGKHYTRVVSKDPILVELQFNDGHRIVGNLYIKPGERLKDEINRDDQFLAITDGKVYDIDSNETNTFRVILVNRDHIIWVNPIQENSRDTSA